MAGASWSYLHFVQQDQIKQLHATLEQKQNKLRSEQQIANQYDHVVHEYAKMSYALETFPKMIPSDLKTYKVYGFLDRASQGDAYTDLNFTFLDSVKAKGYGIIRANISGTGYYRYVYNLIHTIEASYPLAKIKGLIVNPHIHTTKAENTDKTNGKAKGQGITFQEVTFTFELDTYYNRTGLPTSQQL